MADAAGTDPDPDLEWPQRQQVDLIYSKWLVEAPDNNCMHDDLTDILCGRRALRAALPLNWLR
jgi:hypothetical protein